MPQAKIENAYYREMMEKQMGDHVHDLMIDMDGGDFVAHCWLDDCDYEFGQDEINRRLIAVERLNAEDAISIAEGDNPDALWAYAAALEGEE